MHNPVDGRRARVKRYREREGGRRKMWQRIKSFHYGEAALWLLFALAFLSSFGDGYSSNDNAPLLAGIAALAAIGVRVTRLPRINSDAG